MKKQKLSLESIKKVLNRSQMKNIMAGSGGGGGGGCGIACHTDIDCPSQICFACSNPGISPWGECQF